MPSMVRGAGNIDPHELEELVKSPPRIRSAGNIGPLGLEELVISALKD